MNEKERHEIAMVAAVIEGTGCIITKSNEFDPMTASLDTLSEIKNALERASKIVDKLALRRIFKDLNNE
jgi:hypothetical protein